MNLAVIKSSAVKLLGNKALAIQAHSPEILLAAGLTGVVASTVLACRATLKVDQVLEAHRATIEHIDNFVELASVGAVKNEYTDQDRKQDLTVVYIQTAQQVAKLYAPAVIVGVASISCILGAHNILKARNLAVMAAYKTLDEGFKAYRNRVAEAYGEDKEYMLRHGLQVEQVIETEIGKDGKAKKVKSTKMVLADPTMPSIYARFFDEGSTQWSPTPMYNLLFLRNQQDYFNDMLRVRGHVFLNEIYDALGLERSHAGQIVGWVVGHGDSFIDFGLYDGTKPRHPDFVNGKEPNVLLDFNVDGVVYDMI